MGLRSAWFVHFVSIWIPLKCSWFAGWFVSVQVKKLRTWEHLILGGVSGALAATATMPLDVAKTAMQCGGSQNIVRIFQDLIQEKGIAGLYAGMVRRL